MHKGKHYRENRKKTKTLKNKLPVVLIALSIFIFGITNMENIFAYLTAKSSFVNNFTIANWHVIKYDANGGTGTMHDQVIFTDANTSINRNTYTREDYMFTGWNTQPDGSGTSYEDCDIVNNMASTGETLTLYAQWEKFEYTVRFDANGGTGTMEVQEFESGVLQNLRVNSFTREGCSFIGWNTKADRTGIDYTDGQEVKNLAQNNGEEITLYAIWGNVYEYEDQIFTGSNYINTGINLFDAENINKDFEISFEIEDDSSTVSQSTIISSMDERGAPYPGFVFRLNSSTTAPAYELRANVSNTIKTTKSYNRDTTQKVTIKRINKILYISINDDADQQILDYTQLDTTFSSPLIIGASFDGNNNPQRYFTGALANMKVVLYE